MRKYETPAARKHRVLDAVEAMEKRGCSSISLEMVADEMSWAAGFNSARQQNSRDCYKGLGEALNWLVADKLLFTSNKGNSFHTTEQNNNISNKEGNK